MNSSDNVRFLGAVVVTGVCPVDVWELLLADFFTSKLVNGSFDKLLAGMFHHGAHIGDSLELFFWLHNYNLPLMLMDVLPVYFLCCSVLLYQYEPAGSRTSEGNRCSGFWS